MADEPIAKWMSKDGASHEFLAKDASEAADIQSKYLAGDESVSGKVRPKAPAGGGGGGGADLTKTAAPTSQGAPTPSLGEPDFIGKLKNYLTDPSRFSTPEPTMMGAAKLVGQNVIQGTANLVLPGSWGQLAGQTAIAGGGSVVRGAGEAVAKLGLPDLFPSLAKGLEKLPGVARMATQVGLPAIASGGAAALTGGDVSSETKTGAMAGGIASLFNASPVKSFFERFGHIKSQSLWGKIRDNLGPQLADSIGADIPSMNFRLANVADVMDITTEEGGRKYLAKMFDTTERQITRALKGKDFTIDKGSLDALGITTPLNRLGQGSAAQVLSPNNLVKVSAQEAIDISRQLNMLAFRSKPDPSGYPVRQVAKDMQGRILAAIDKVDADLSSRYAQLKGDYGKLLPLKDVLAGDFDKIFPTMTSGGATFDPVRMFSNMKDNYGNLSPYEYPNLWRFFAGKEPTGSGPVETSLFGAVRPRLFGKGLGLPVGMSEQVPKFGSIRFPSGLSPYPTGPAGHATAGKIAGVMSVPTIESMMLDRMDAEESGQGQPTR